jgi:hypothetical protein
VKQPDVRIGAKHHFPSHLQHQTKHTVGRRVLGTEIQGKGLLDPWSKSAFKSHRIKERNTEAVFYRPPQ